MLQNLLSKTLVLNGSDLLLVDGAAPAVLVGGHWQSLSDERLTSARIEQIMEPLLTPQQRTRLSEVRDLDIGLTLAAIGRFRINMHYQRGTLGVAIRLIPAQVPSFESLNLPQQLQSFSDYPNGLVLVT